MIAEQEQSDKKGYRKSEDNQKNLAAGFRGEALQFL
jgi:hypothetical protein